MYAQTADITVTSAFSLPEFGGIYDGRGHRLTMPATMFEKLTGAVQDLTLCGDVISTGAYNGKLTFTGADSAAYAVCVGLTASGSYRLYGENGAQFSAATYTDGMFAGDWITEEDGVLSVAVSDAGVTTVTMGGTAMQDVRNAVYNDMQALCFTHNGLEYYLADYRPGIARLYGRSMFTAGHARTCALP